MIFFFIDVYKENLFSHRYGIGKGRKFSDNCKYSPLILHQNLARSSFLTVSWNVESEVISINFSYPVILKSTSFSYTLNDYFIPRWFCQFIQSSFGNQMADLCSFSKGWHSSLYIIKKWQSLTASPVSSAKCLNYQETTKLMVVDENFPSYSFSFDSSNFITITVSCLPQNARLILLIFEDMSAQ